MYREWIAECARNFGPPPRRFSYWDRLTYWRTPRPRWLRNYPNDKLRTIFDHYLEVREEGKVVWGHTIQANSMIFKPGNEDTGGEFLYSLDAANPPAPMELGQLAAAIFSLKQQNPDTPELESISEYLKDEHIRVYGQLVPSVLSPNRPYHISTTWFYRKHFPPPHHCLQRPLVPLVVNPIHPYVTILLPSRYWPKEMVQWWTAKSPV